MPLARTALQGLGENDIKVWPGSDSNTKDIIRFIAKELRSFVISILGLMRIKDFPKSIPHLQKMIGNAPNILARLRNLHS